MKNIISTTLWIACLLQISNNADAQCRAWTKNHCLPNLKGYVQNDNYNTAYLVPGDEAELLLTFFGGKEYRIVVCNHPILKEVKYTVTDTSGEPIYTGIASENGTFDFKVIKTQQLMVKLKVALDPDAVMVQEGCVSLLVGSKEIQ